MKKIIYNIRLYFLKRKLKTLSNNLSSLKGKEIEALLRAGLNSEEYMIDDGEIPANFYQCESDEYNDEPNNEENED